MCVCETLLRYLAWRFLTSQERQIAQKGPCHMRVRLCCVVWRFLFVYIVASRFGSLTARPVARISRDPWEPHQAFSFRLAVSRVMSAQDGVKVLNKTRFIKRLLSFICKGQKKVVYPKTTLRRAAATKFFFVLRSSQTVGAHYDMIRCCQCRKPSFVETEDSV